MDKADIHSAITSQESNSEREIQNSDKVVSYYLGEHCMVQTRSDNINLVCGECLIYYVDEQLRSLDNTMVFPPSLMTDYQRIGEVQSHIEHVGDIKLFW